MDTTSSGHLAVTGADVEEMLDRFRRGELTLPALAASCFEAGRIAASADRAVQIMGAAAESVRCPGCGRADCHNPRLECDGNEAFEHVVHSDTGQALGLVHHDSPRISPAPGWFLIRANRTIADYEIERLWHAAAYAWKASARGEPIGKPMRTDDQSFYCEVDLTSSRRSDPTDALTEFEDTLVRLVAHGSALRTSDRAGIGTKGTRAVDPFGDSTMCVDLLWPAAGDHTAQGNENAPAVDEFGPAPIHHHAVASAGDDF